MSWQPGQPVITATDEAEWRAWKRTQKIESQRLRRLRYRRIDYYPSEDVLALIEARAHRSIGGNYSAIIDALVLAGAEAQRRRAYRLPE